jgi:hypothetical protein
LPQVGDAVFFEPDTFAMENNLKKGFRTHKTRDVDPEKYPEYYRKMKEVKNRFLR